MKQTTVARLNTINYQLYNQGGEEFSETRQTLWPGWKQAFEYVSKPSGRLNVLDLGCGNGRLIEILLHKKLAFSYTGVDNSETLLNIANDKYAKENRVCLIKSNLLDDDWQQQIPSNSYDVIALLGVLHHIPGVENRQHLLQRCRSLLVSEGLMMVSFWMFAEKNRFSERIVDWSSVEPELYDDLETGDYLLPFGKQKRIRYCHFAKEEEQEQLMVLPDLTLVDRFRDDGKSKDLNAYWILQKQEM